MYMHIRCVILEGLRNRFGFFFLLFSIGLHFHVAITSTIIHTYNSRSEDIIICYYCTAFIMNMRCIGGNSTMFLDA